MKHDEFRELIWQKGREFYRDMPWRQDTRPYYVLVSELMLQQTQVERVIPKFDDFIAAFPDERALARASLADVLRLWQGLGYNVRAKYLHEAAKRVVHEYDGVWPETIEELQRLPGVGPNTAGAIMAYVYNSPAIFVETNIRSVYFHHFFEGDVAVTDHQLRAKLGETLDREHPREFYWALMDYGSWLKRQGLGKIGLSRHYKKQSPLEGSVRQVRGRIVAALAGGDLTEEILARVVERDHRFDLALAGLIRDGLVMRRGTEVHLTK
ncbi:MAG TPA: A/G-specific adenine glycosylase [Candidatus Saccharibacteria bacterium]|nr:A/G-specific adenine glycosylase [Candidatus Saccharibacteria bacterium]